jgi:hypothetical protein
MDGKNSMTRQWTASRLWLRWMAATAAGVVLAFAAFAALFPIIGDPADALFPIIMTGFGVVIGAFQQRVLRPGLADARRRALATGLGLGAGIALVVTVRLGDTAGVAAQIAQGAAAGAVAGAVIGTLQWLVLRSRIPGSRWWVPASIGGWVTGVAAGTPSGIWPPAWTSSSRRSSPPRSPGSRWRHSSARAGTAVQGSMHSPRWHHPRTQPANSAAMNKIGADEGARSEATTIDLRGLTKRFGTTAAADDLTARISARRGHRLPGPERRAHTTTLRMLFALVAPTAGAATIAWRCHGRAERHVLPLVRTLANEASVSISTPRTASGGVAVVSIWQRKRHAGCDCSAGSAHTATPERVMRAFKPITSDVPAGARSARPHDPAPQAPTPADPHRAPPLRRARSTSPSAGSRSRRRAGTYAPRTAGSCCPGRLIAADPIAGDIPLPTRQRSSTALGGPPAT